jgi:hypothetical protein
MHGSASTTARTGGGYPPGAPGAVTLALLVSGRFCLKACRKAWRRSLRGGPVMKVLVDLTA